MNNKEISAGAEVDSSTNDATIPSAPLLPNPVLAAALSVKMIKVLITWFNSLEKANLFCQWVSENYKHRNATIEKDSDSDCHWIYVHIKEEDASPFQMVAMVHSAIQDNPTLAKH